MNNKIHEILKQYWGYDFFRPLQEEIIASVLMGQDTLGMLPTGGGKSITFQVPALTLGGLTLVVTPLISLMKDQCDHLLERGIKAAAIFMGMSHQEVLETYERVIVQDYRFLYISPERLETQLFQAKLQYMDVRLLVVDEAHCISQWGYDFRPPYLKISNLRTLLKEIRERNRSPWIGINQEGLAVFRNGSTSNTGQPNYHVPCLALTATATNEVVQDIQDKLNFRRGAQVFRASFVRPNLTYSVIHTEDKLGYMLRLLKAQESAIVYVRSRKRTAEVAEQLTNEGLFADFYHAGLKPEDKQKRQDAWMEGNPPIIVATNAFGMGIDKSNVRLVIHIDLPPSPEEYFQEAGRAGRDGEPAEAILLVSEDDKTKLHRHLLEEYPERDFIRHVYGRLASFFQVAISAGLYHTFEFDLMRFCAAYHLGITQAHYALKLLDQAGYIRYIEDPDRHSRLMITTTREGLYHTNQFDPECQRILHALLRLYTGLFADYIYIDEEEIMRVTKLNRQTLYEKLLLLSRFHVLHYIPARQMPAIVYLEPRLEDEEIRIPHMIYEDRQARQEHRINAMIEYVDNREECRLIQLLKYFGENIQHRCGLCDICQSEGLHGNKQEESAMVRQLILDKLKTNGPLSPYQIINQLKFNPNQIGESLREMVEEEILVLEENILRLP